jgi:hypothetical protein
MMSLDQGRTPHETPPLHACICDTVRIITVTTPPRVHPGGSEKSNYCSQRSSSAPWSMRDELASPNFSDATMPLLPSPRSINQSLNIKRSEIAPRGKISEEGSLSNR